jgi:hypothetical protein
MDRTGFTNFDLTIKPAGHTEPYNVSVTSECGGNFEGTFTPNELGLDPADSDQQGSPAQSDATPTPEASEATKFSLLDVIPPSSQRARSFGQRLFKAVFKGDLRIALERCITATRAVEVPLRIRLNLTHVPHLAALPWEFICIEPENNFFARSYNSVVRYLELKLPFDDALLTQPPLRILAVVSNPSGTSKLDVAGEVENLKGAVKGMEEKGLIVLDVLERPTVRAIRMRLHERRRTVPYHVFHFIGHAAFDPAAREGRLLLENEAGGASRVSALELGQMLSPYRSLRLAVINACEGARTSPGDVYAGVAQTLLRSGAVPAVIAMQYRIRDSAAKIFSQTFYEELLRNEDVDTAVAVGRMAISDIQSGKGLGEDEPVEWATPVLYMRATNSRLVDFSGAALPEVVENPPPDPEPARAPGSLDDHYQEVVKELLAGSLVPFLGLDVNLFEPKAKARPPAYAELVEHLTRFSDYPYNAGVPLAVVSQYAQLPDRLADLYDQLAPLFDKPEYEPTTLHKFWARVARERTRERAGVDPKRRRFVIVTTSYDELLERAFSEAVRDFHVYSYIAYGGDQERGRFFSIRYRNGQADKPLLVGDGGEGLNDELPIILKLPGSIKAYNSRIRFAITEDQYFTLLTNRNLTSDLPSELMEKLRGCHHLFLGYNVSDWNTRGVLYRIWETQKAPYDSWAVQEGTTEFEHKYWDACGVEVVNENLARYVAELDARLH